MIYPCLSYISYNNKDYKPPGTSILHSGQLYTHFYHIHISYYNTILIYIYRVFIAIWNKVNAFFGQKIFSLKSWKINIYEYLKTFHETKIVSEKAFRCLKREGGISCSYAFLGICEAIFRGRTHPYFLFGTSYQNLNEYLETLHLALTQFCDLPGFYRKTGFLRNHTYFVLKYQRKVYKKIVC